MPFAFSEQSKWLIKGVLLATIMKTVVEKTQKSFSLYRDESRILGFKAAGQTEHAFIQQNWTINVNGGPSEPEQKPRTELHLSVLSQQ